MNIQSLPNLDRDLALSLVSDVIKTLDQAPLPPFIDAMMDESWEAALAMGKISGDAPDDLGLFVRFCRKVFLGMNWAVFPKFMQPSLRTV